jgi:hypothetical protein
MADAGGLDLHEELARAGLIQLEFRDGDRSRVCEGSLCTNFLEDGSSDLHSAILSRFDPEST